MSKEINNQSQNIEKSKSNPPQDIKHVKEDQAKGGKKKKKTLDSVSFIPTPDGDFLLTIPEAAMILKIHQRTIERQIEDRGLPVVRIRSKRRIRWSVLTGERKVEA